MKMVFRIFLVLLYSIMSWQPAALAASSLGVTKVQITHSHTDGDHHHHHQGSDDADNHQHADQQSEKQKNVSPNTDTTKYSSKEQKKDRDSHTHEVLISGMSFDLVESKAALGTSHNLQTCFPIPTDLTIPYSHFLDSIFRPPILA